MSEPPSDGRRLVVRLSDEERQAIANKARDAEKTISDYVRGLALGAEIERRQRHLWVPPDLVETVAHLSRIGNNLNQLARAANSGDPIDRAKLDAVLEKLLATLRQLNP